MELKAYSQVLLRRWWIVVPAFLITFMATLVFTFTQVPAYKATATFVVAPSGSFETIGSFVNGLEILSRRTEIANTYTEVASSSLIKRQAADQLNLSPEQKKGLSVDSNLLGGTNVIEISVEGSDPALVKDMANTIGAQTVIYVQDLYESYSLTPLDSATLPTSPIAPNKMLNLAMGVGVGLVLGVGLAFLSEYLQTPLESIRNFGVLDDETGAYNKRHFTQRLGEEVSRARRNGYPLSLALMNVDRLGIMGTSFSPQARSELLRKVTVFLKQYLREEDVIARLDETTFAFLLPDMAEAEARAATEKLQTRIAWTPFEVEKSGVKLNLGSAASVASYSHNGTGQDEFLAEALHALQRAEAANHDTVCVLEEDEASAGLEDRKQ